MNAKARFIKKHHSRLSKAALLGVALASPSVLLAQTRNFATQALWHVAGQQGVGVEELKIAESARAHLPLTDTELAEFKVMASDGRTFGVSFNVATEQVVDPLTVAEQEQLERASIYGVIEPALFDRLQRNAAERIPVAIWVAMEDPGTLGRGPTRNLNALAARVRAAQTPALNAARGLGATINLADLPQANLAPVFFAELNAGQINAFSRLPTVIAIQEIPQNLRRLNDDSATSDRYPFVWSRSTANGSGAVVAVHEDDGVDNVNTFVVDPIYWCTGVGAGPGGSACTVGRNIDRHATNVAGVIASTHQWRRGGAWGLAAGSLLSANFQSFNAAGDAQKIVNSATWALNNGADTVNMSWGGCSSGGQTFFSRWVDYLVKTFGDNIVVSSGNNNCGTPGNPGFVLSPSLGWNTISVGSYFDKNTGLRSDDVFSLFTSYKNPTDPTSGRTYEKPDVIGMGGNTDKTPPNHTQCFGSETTGVGGGANDSTCGTSFAAPDVAGLTALIVGKNPTGLRDNAEAVKAIIMAGATHNIVDGTNYRDCPTSPVSGDCRDGAGGIDAFQTIENIVRLDAWSSGFLTPDSFDANGNIDFPATVVDSGDSIRVAIAWDSTATCSDLGTAAQDCANDVLNADLDLVLVDASGTVVAESASFQNSAEVIDFKATTSGTYTTRIKNFRFDAGTNTFLGVAWNHDTRDFLSPLTLTNSFALNTTKTHQTTNKGTSFWDKYSGPAAGACAFLNSETGLEKVYSIQTSSTGKITATLSNTVGFTGVSSNLDVIVLKKSGAANSQNTKVVGCGDTTAVASSQPAGTYYVVVDGRNGSVAKFNLRVKFAAGS